MRRIWTTTLILCTTLVCSAGEVDIPQVFNAGLPVLQIETVNGEEPTADRLNPPEGGMGATITNVNKVPGRLTITIGGEMVYDSGEYIEKESGITIRVRGNTSGYREKKPYKIKLQKKADLLFRGNDSVYKDKDWVLLKDEKLLTKVGFKINELMEMQWTPAYQYVNVILNGEYKGFYMLVESVSRNTKCRLNVSKTGFIFEYDPYWWNEDVYVKSPTLSHSMHYTFKYPDSKDITEEQLDYFTDMITEAEYALKDGTYDKYIDMKSLTSWLLAQDILGQWDAGGANYYLTKYDDTRNSKIMMANLWDFDHILTTENKWCGMHNRYFFFREIINDGIFFKAYKKRFNEVSPAIFRDIISYLDQYAASEEAVAVNKSIELNNIRWDDDYEGVNENIDNAKDWFIRREVWMNDTINGKSTGIMNIETEGADKTYYNLQGQRVASPRHGLYIKDGKKIILK